MNMDGSLRITSVRNQDVGTYRCQVTSVGGNDSASAAIEIIGGWTLYKREVCDQSHIQVKLHNNFKEVE